MQTIRIILSAAKSLQQEKLELADLVENLNHSLERRNANILMLVWDGSETDKNDFKDKISDTDLCLTLYYDTFDESTQSELETAYQSLCEGKNPKKIYVYFKEAETVPEQLKTFRDSFPTKYGHFYCSFSNIDTLKADFLLQFMEYQSENLSSNKMLEVNNGKVTIDGKEYVDLKNVPFAGNNEEYNLLLKSIKKTQKLLAITDEDDPDYADYAADLQDMKEKLAKMESSLWDTALMITRLSTTKCSERLKRAMDLFTAGDNKGAQAVLNEEEIERDVEHNLHLIKLGEEGEKGLKINIDEYRLKIKTLENEMAEGWLYESCKLHERTIELTSSLYGENSLETAQALMDATQAIYLIEDYEKLYQYTQKALTIRLEILGEMHLDTAQCYNDLGVVSGKLGDYKSYLENANKGLEIREKIGAPDALLAESYNTVGFAYSHFGENEKNLEYQLKSLELRRRTFGEMNIETANAYSNVGIAYVALEQDEKYLDYSLRSLEIKKEIVGDKHPDTALSHNNVGDAYMCIQDYPNAIIHLLEALSINISTVGYQKEGTLKIIENLSLAYELNDELEKSIDYQMEAIKISEMLLGRIHTRTQLSYQRAGEKLDAYGDWKLALKYLYEAFDIQLKISGEPSFGLADLCHKIGSLHYVLNDYENAKRMVENAINILSDVDDNHPLIKEWQKHLHTINENNKTK